MTQYLFTEDPTLTGFEQLSIPQPDDYEGRVVTTLVRRRTDEPQAIAMLRVHGFNDYFFHAEAAEKYDALGVELYGVDLRKSGRSLLPHQKMNNLRNISEYFADITACLEIIKAQHHQLVILEGHSMGGLAAALYATEDQYNKLWDGLFLNSPFFEQNKDLATRKILIPLVSGLGSHLPNLLVPGGFSKFYGPSLHLSGHGRFNYNLSWKPHVAPLVNAGWVKAIYEAQKRIWHGISINKPTLIAYPSRSYHNLWWNDAFLRSDAVVNVKHIRKYAHMVKGQVTQVEIDGAVHDLYLSAPQVQENVLSIVNSWISNTFEPVIR